MKNFVKLFGIMALVAVIGFSMIACDDDDNDSIVGTWKGSFTDEGVTVNVTVVVNSNGTGTSTYTAGYDSGTDPFTWTQVGSTVSFTMYGETDTFTFNGGNSFTIDSVTYKRK